jgi:hypothetical protein
MDICLNTVGRLSQFEKISDRLVRNAAAELAERPERTTRVGHHGIGDNLCSATILAVAEQLYRFRVCPELLGSLLDYREQFARGLSAAFAAKAMRSQFKRHVRDESKLNMGDSKTRAGQVRNLVAEVELIGQTAAELLFGAVEKLQVILPMKWDSVIDFQSGYSTGRTWQSFRCFDTMTGDEPLFASYIDPVEEKMLSEIMTHNQNCGPNRWQFVMATTRHADKVNDLFEEDVTTVRRIKRAMVAKMSSVIMSCFAQAAYRFIILEFGHSTELQNGLEENRSDKMNRKNPDGIPFLLTDALLSQKLTPLQMRILQVNSLDFVQNGLDILERINLVAERPVSKSTFFEHYTPLRKLAEKLALEIVED